jgi:predicted metalloprotease with PDZ domain
MRFASNVLVACLVAVAFPVFVAAEVVYRVTPTDERQQLRIEMSFDASTPTVELQLPSWSPGMYSIRNSWDTLRELTATNEEGGRLAVTHTRGDTWTIAAAGHKRITVRYERPLQKARFDYDQSASEADVLHYGAEPVYLYVVDRKSEPCILELVVSAGWKTAVGLRKTRSRDGNPTYRARNYDELADNPVTMGDYIEERYTEYGKEHVLAFRGPARDWIDRQKTMEMTRFVTQIEDDFFGGAPYEKYVWHFWVYEGPSLAGGTEHASSTEMHLSTEEGPNTVQGMAHEFFHLWNAKRIRPRPLGPFDYTQLPRTGSLWWIEGVTDYYSMLLPYRYGAWNREAFLSRALDELQQVRSNPTRLEVSPYDSSYKISKENGDYYKVNYYPTGWVLGMMFDIELRTRTEGKSSLDDVMRALWNLYKDDHPGFAENEIRRQLVRFGGEGMGPLYDQWVLSLGDLPVEQEMAKAGLQIDEQGGGAAIHERLNLTLAQSRTLEGWLRTGMSTRMPPPRETTLPAATAGADPSNFEGDTGRYEIANNVLFVINKDARGLTAGFENGDKTELTPVPGETFFYPHRHALLTFARDDQGAVTGILWKQNGKERSVPRIGPFIHSLEARPDPDTAFTKKVLSVLEALGEGVHKDVRTPGLAPGAWADYCSSGPVRGPVAIRSLDYIDSQSVAGRHIERHHGEVSRIDYYKLVTAKKTRYLMVYLTGNGLVTDFDYVED